MQALWLFIVFYLRLSLYVYYSEATTSLSLKKLQNHHYDNRVKVLAYGKLQNKCAVVQFYASS